MGQISSESIRWQERLQKQLWLEHRTRRVFLFSTQEIRLNPKATEYGIVLKGTGMIQVVYPNGTSAMNTEVKEGDVFWVPRYFPFCQIASRAGPMEFFGFTTSARKNRPQFLVGASSILRSMRGPELAAAFGLSLERLGNLTSFQRESVILPTSAASPPVKLAKPIRSLKE